MAWSKNNKSILHLRSTECGERKRGGVKLIPWLKKRFNPWFLMPFPTNLLLVLFSSFMSKTKRLSAYKKEQFHCIVLSDWLYYNARVHSLIIESNSLRFRHRQTDTAAQLERWMNKETHIGECKLSHHIHSNIFTTNISAFVVLNASDMELVFDGHTLTKDALMSQENSHIYNVFHVTNKFSSFHITQ